MCVQPINVDKVAKPQVTLFYTAFFLAWCWIVYVIHVEHSILQIKFYVIWVSMTGGGEPP